MTRVVSLVPSVTETLLAWGVTPVAVTRFCDAPGLPTVGGTKNPQVDSIVALAPEVVVMDKEENRSEDAAALEAAGIRVLALHVRSLRDVRGALQDLARSLELTCTAEELEESRVEGPTVWVPIWKRPWMSIGGGTYASSLLAAAGLRNVLESSGELYPEVVPDRADFVLAPSEPYRFGERNRRELEQVGSVVFVDGRDLFWWGWRTPAALGRLKQLAARLVEG